MWACGYNQSGELGDGTTIDKYIPIKVLGLCNDVNSVSTSVNSIDIIFFPNPFSTQTTLQTNTPLHNATLTVYNSFGQEVTQSVIPSGARNLTITRDGLPSGIYFLRLTALSLPSSSGGGTQGGGGEVFTGKLVITDSR
ncbi:MAG: T9SS type A sorting domain-containing protein [Bacteroidetes bacterium]|nr:T9SS type A sorting domain-containing protein [Bacteroidota bacterium]